MKQPASCHNHTHRIVSGGKSQIARHTSPHLPTDPDRRRQEM
jgi:hypothetical protein